MAFGQASGPPASGKQMRELEALLEAAGHVDFRDARGPMGFTQRQAGGKFTRNEAEVFIEQLESEVYGNGPPPAEEPIHEKAPPKAAKPAPNAKANSAQPRPKERRTARPVAKYSSSIDLSGVTDEVLAAELQSRGWIVVEP